MSSETHVRSVYGDLGDRTAVPRLIRWSLYALLAVAALASLPMVGRYSPLPLSTALDFWIGLFLLTALVRGPLRAPVLLVGLVGYTLSWLTPGLASDAPLPDLVQGYKWAIYLLVFALAIGRRWEPTRGLVRLTWFLLIMAIIKSVLSLLLEGPGERPGLLTESNYDIALYSGLTIVCYRHMGRSRALMILLLGLIVILSGSRSGAVTFFIVALFAVFQARNSSLILKYLMACAIPLLAWVPLMVFQARSAGGVSIDRLGFLDVFLAETSDWSPLNWLFGTTPLTPLSSSACNSLSYFQGLFSTAGDGSCYSVILHAFVLRIVFDAGIVGLVFAIAILWYTMRRAGLNRFMTLTFLAIVIANGLSVSGLNNPYVALPVLLGILTAQSPSGVPTTNHKAVR
ncbi:hypothetical protein HNR11_001965 [Nesterenkonia sandarakina]|uniref:O-antigen ligase-like membrane protein n=1 Tax=Nesterenkonia sandarakina TaxID=272918 RepID=A0A7Z0E9I6_9MICC|nr:hypothetical protein [Nesterenkonia sandarakina]